LTVRGQLRAYGGSRHLLNTIIFILLFNGLIDIFVFFCVALPVVVQVALGDEGGLTTCKIAHVGSHSGMRSDVSLQVTFLVKAFVATSVGTDKRLLAIL
jgi:hypothetical protein